jgi:hypothetical protein
VDLVMEEFVARLTAHFRAKAADRRAEGGQAAAVYECVAGEIEQHYRTYALEEVSGPEAMRLSGYSEARIYQLRKDDRITFRRGDLPRRPGAGRATGPVLSPSGDGDTRPSMAERRLARTVGAA